MDIQEIVETQRKVLQAMSPPLEAAGVGGSIGRGTSDQYSDVDFFLLYPTQDFFLNLKQFPQRITHPLPVLLYTEITFVPGFGFEYSYILQDGFAVDYILNCPDTMSINPLRAHTSILFDNTGFMTQLTNTAHLQISEKPLESVRNAMHEYLGRLLKLRKSAYRHDRPVLYYHLDKLRLVMTGIDRTLATGKPYNSFHSDHRLGQEMGAEYERGIQATLPSRSTDSFVSAFTEVCRRIYQGLVSLDDECLNWTDAWLLERRLKAEVISFIKKSR